MTEVHGLAKKYSLKLLLHQSNMLEIVQSKNGISIRLTDERWTHI